MTEKVHFKESQKFTQWWLWLLLLLPFTIAFWSSYQDLSNRSLAEISAAKLVESILPVFVLLLFILLFLSLKLETEVRNEGIFVRFKPFQRQWKKFGWSETESASVNKYSPLGDYLGWGIRWGRKGKAYSVRGSQGLQLVLKNGDRLLIGTQKADELQRAVEEARG